MVFFGNFFNLRHLRDEANLGNLGSWETLLNSPASNSFHGAGQTRPIGKKRSGLEHLPVTAAWGHAAYKGSCGFGLCRPAALRGPRFCQRLKSLQRILPSKSIFCLVCVEVVESTLTAERMRYTNHKGQA